jgi:hypothetical protein
LVDKFLSIRPEENDEDNRERPNVITIEGIVSEILDNENIVNNRPLVGMSHQMPIEHYMIENLTG